MKTKVAVLVAVFSLPLLAQSPLEVKGHVLEETAQEFVARAQHPNPVERCDSFASDAKKVKKDQRQKRDAENYARQAAKLGASYTPHSTMDSCNALLSVVRDGSQSRIEIVGEPQIKPNEVGDMWSGATSTIQNGRLAQVELRMKMGYSDIMPSMISKYGEPTKTSTNKAQNGYGASFDLGEAAWLTTDGETIHLVESVAFNRFDGYVRAVTIEFRSKAETERLAQSLSSRPNPLN